MQSTSDQALHPFLKVDNKSFEASFKSHYSELCRFAYKYVSEETGAEELVQEVFINLWQNRDTLQIHSSYEQYLYASVRNRCLNFAKRRAFLRKTHDTIQQNSPVEHDSLTEWLHYRELDAVIKQSIAALPDRCRQIFHLSRNEGFTYSEIAKQMKISEKTVENQISIALKKLRENLADHFITVLLFLFWQS